MDWLFFLELLGNWFGLLCRRQIAATAAQAPSPRRGFESAAVNCQPQCKHWSIPLYLFASPASEKKCTRICPAALLPVCPDGRNSSFFCLSKRKTQRKRHPGGEDFGFFPSRDPPYLKRPEGGQRAPFWKSPVAAPRPELPFYVAGAGVPDGPYSLYHDPLKMAKHYCYIYDADIAKNDDRLSPLAQIQKPRETIKNN